MRINGQRREQQCGDQWVQRESTRRTKLVAFCYINVHSIAYNIHPVLWSSELHLRLPWYVNPVYEVHVKQVLILETNVQLHGRMASP
jgi:hypothetical protein